MVQDLQARIKGLGSEWFLNVFQLHCKKIDQFEQLIGQYSENFDSFLNDAKNLNTEQGEELNFMISTVLLIDTITSEKYDLVYIEALIKNGANINIQDKDRNTPLHMVTKKGSLVAVETLVDNGANINIQNNEGDSPLHIAVKKVFSDIVILLINNGANMCALNYEHMESILHLTIKEAKNENDIIALLELISMDQININAQDADGHNPLHMACINGHTNIVRFLIDHGADPNIQNHEGNTPLHIAAEYGYTEIIHILINSGARTDIKNHKGLTAQEVAKKCDAGDVEVLEEFLPESVVNFSAERASTR